MNEEVKIPELKIHASVGNTKELKKLLSELAALEENYEIVINVDYLPESTLATAL